LKTAHRLLPISNEKRDKKKGLLNAFAYNEAVSVGFARI
jgi:hypothetical protein